MLRFCAQLYDLNIRYRNIAARSGNYGKRIIASEHDDIFSAALARDVENSVRLLVEHYRRTSADRYAADPTTSHFAQLIAASDPLRQKLLRRLSKRIRATAQLVRIRADILRLLRDTPELGRVDLDFTHLLSSSFNRRFLVLRPINWDTPAAILEKMIEYVAVHAIDTWEALHLRVEPQDRRCFAFFHPAMPNEPLIFVEVALSRGVPGRIDEVLAPDRAAIRPAEVDTAVFYSISNCQKGLSGNGFGNSLINQASKNCRARCLI